MCLASEYDNLITLQDYFALIDEQIIELSITRENLIHVLKKWDEFDNQKIDEIILTHHDDGTVTIDGR